MNSSWNHLVWLLLLLPFAANHGLVFFYCVLCECWLLYWVAYLHKYENCIFIAIHWNWSKTFFDIRHFFWGWWEGGVKKSRIKRRRLFVCKSSTLYEIILCACVYVCVCMYVSDTLLQFIHLNLIWNNRIIQLKNSIHFIQLKVFFLLLLISNFSWFVFLLACLHFRFK